MAKTTNLSQEDNRPQTRVNHLDDGSIEIETTIKQEKIKFTYDQVLDQFQKITEIKGFRKGKAPKERIEKVIGTEEIYHEVVNQLLPQVYQDIIEKNYLKPIITPKAELISAKEGKDWQVKFTTCELPEIDLNNYREEIQKIAVKEAIWTPEKGTNDKDKADKDQSLEKAQRFQKIIDTIAKVVRVTLPKILIENDTNQKLANLIEKTEKMGLSLDQYLAAIGKTADNIKKDYWQESEKNWKLELALTKIADKEKITVSEQDIDDALIKISDVKERKQLSNQRYLLSSMIRRQKTLEFLQSL